jgi:gamma-glutamylcyclotransferase (GGCT)/AIG2-like uncharacterized protein YtfP
MLVRESNSALRIFVYGTLRSDCNSGAHQRFLGKAKFIGSARLQARLFRISYYPAITLTLDDHWVQGEVYELTSEQDLALLDDYEECSATPDPAQEYRREQVMVILANGERDWVWTYVYQRATEGLTIIESGDFIAG